MVRFIFTLILLAVSSKAITQSSRDAAIEVTVVVDNDSPSLTINWPFSDAATQYQVFRKEKSGISWGIAKATLQGSVTSYKDISVQIGKEYEYKIVRSAQGVTGYGYVLTGIEIPVKQLRGRVLVLTDESVKEDIQAQLPVYLSDLEGDGWSASLAWIVKGASVKEVKGTITQWYGLDKSTAKAIIILGHVPVPYSGNLNPDGHPDHLGAWPCDAYYGDVDGVWTDASINSSVATDVRNKNVPGDGKFDQNTFPSAIELQVGRVDFDNLPLFSESPGKLLSVYLDKNHAYRHKKWSPAAQGLIDDNFGYFSGEAFAATGWRNFSTLCRKDQVFEGDYFAKQKEQSFLWSYGCGPGSYTSAGGIGTSIDFSNSQLNGVFTILFGSYFGDWDSQNNLMRSALAQGKILTCSWGGRPHWYFHHMGLGENIGYSTLLTQNNNGLYYTHYAAKFVHISLLGDPTLRNDIAAPPSALLAEREGSTIHLQWENPVDSVNGYEVYLKKPGENVFTIQNDTLLTDNKMEITCVVDTGIYIVMVKAVKLVNQSSGSYYNSSQGVFDTLQIDVSSRVIAKAKYSIDRNTISFFDQSVNATFWEWSFDNGVISTEKNPVIYLTAGIHTAQLIVSNSCGTDTLLITLEVTSSVSESSASNSQLLIYPNPAVHSMQWKLHGVSSNFEHLITIYNSMGQTVWSKRTNECSGTIDIGALPSGLYQCSVKSHDLAGTIKSFVIAR